MVRKFLQANFNNTTGPRPVLLSPASKEELRERYAHENAQLLSAQTSNSEGVGK